MSARSESPSLGIQLPPPVLRSRPIGGEPPDPRAHLVRAAEAGYTWARFPVSWGWFEPRAGELDEDRFRQCLELMEEARDLGLTSVVSLAPGPTPAWVGGGFWLHPQAPERYGLWVEAAATRLAGACRHWITLSRMNAHALGPWLPGGSGPGRTLATGDAVRAMGHMLAAQATAHRVVHRIRPDAQVTTDNRTSSVYEADRLGIDILLAPRRKVPRRELADWLRDRRGTFYGALPHPSPAEWWLRRMVAGAIPLDQAYPRAVAAAYDSDGMAAIDSVHLAFTNPRLAEVAALRLRAALSPAAGGGRLPQCHPPRLGELATYCQLNHEPGLELWISVPGHRHPAEHQREPATRCGWDGPRLAAAVVAASGSQAATVIHADQALRRPARPRPNPVPESPQAAM